LYHAPIQRKNANARSVIEQRGPMLSAERNELITGSGPGTKLGALLRRYWPPAALVDQLNGVRPVTRVRLLGETFVLFRDDESRYGLLDNHCAHRGADLCFGRVEDGGLRCPFHGWLFDLNGTCLDQPAEPSQGNLRGKRLQPSLSPTPMACCAARPWYARKPCASCAAA
jgi:nitrite reductase/ring-hydroxylating ferredoxin subunit